MKKKNGILSWLGMTSKKAWAEREHTRVRTYSLIKFNLEDGTPFQSISNITNMSESGLQFTCYEKLEINRNIHMVVHVPRTDKEIPIEARLVWTRKSRSQRGVYVTGVEFKKISEKGLELIRGMVSQAKSH